MIGTLLRIGWINFRRDRVALALTFVLPIIFFSIFAGVFGNQRDSATRRVPVAVVDEDGSEFSKALVAALEAEGALRVRTTRESEGPGRPARPRRRRGARQGRGLPGGGRPAEGPRGDEQVLGRRWRPRRPRCSSSPTCPIRSRRRSCRACCRKSASRRRPRRWRPKAWRCSRSTAARSRGEQRASVDQWVSSHAQEPARRARSGSSAGAGVRVADRDRQRDAARRRRHGDRLVLRGGHRRDVPAVLVRRRRRHAARGGGERHARPADRLARRHDGRARRQMAVHRDDGRCCSSTVMFTWGALVFGLPLLPHLPGFLRHDRVHRGRGRRASASCSRR